MLTIAGHFFHIDFGFILGRDPKGITVPMVRGNTDIIIIIYYLLFF